MPIHLVTGLPGAGKSLGAVEQILKFRKAEPNRPVYVLGIDGLRDDVALPLTPDSLRAWWELPTGSVVLVDECQKYMPARRQGDPPEWIRKLSEHRHFGLDFVLCTQSPGYVDSYVRGLIDRHTHLVRKFGTGLVDRYEWPAVCANPLNRSERKQARKSLWRYPKECFKLYKSAELHTVKRRIPWKVWAIAALPLVVLALGAVAFHSMEKGGGAGAASVRAGASVVAGAPVSGSSGEGRHWATVDAYVKDHLPRVANQPWSAPVYDQQQVVAHPDLYCIRYEAPSMAGGMDDRCGCYTEQGTPYELHDLAACRRYARDGVYNPRRAPMAAPVVADLDRASASGQSSGVRGGAPAVAGASHAAPWPGSASAIHSAYVEPERLQAPTRASPWSGG